MNSSFIHVIHVIHVINREIFMVLNVHKNIIFE
jgi:hypothetical protein